MQSSDKPLRIESTLRRDAERLYFFLLMTVGSEAYAERFEDELEDALAEIRDYPDGHGFHREPVRRRHLKSVPAFVLYEETEEETVAFMVVHERTDPATINERIDERR